MTDGPPGMRWPLGPDVGVLVAQAGGVLALDKPAGVLAHPNRAGVARRALVRLAYDPGAECYLGEGGDRLYLCNRIDSPTSGVVVLAESAGLADAIKAAFRRHAVVKEYVALVKGLPRPPEQVWEDRLERRGEAGRVRVRARKQAAGSPGGAPARTRIVREADWGLSCGRISRLRLFPETGRTHQLRVQAARRRHPVVGDRNYGDFGFNRAYAGETGAKRLMLHAARTAFSLTYQGRNVEIDARSPTPSEFSQP